MTPGRVLPGSVLQLEIVCDGCGTAGDCHEDWRCFHKKAILTCTGLNGDELVRLELHKTETAWDAGRRVAQALKTNIQSLRMILPNQQVFEGNAWNRLSRVSMWMLASSNADGSGLQSRLVDAWD